MRSRIVAIAWAVSCTTMSVATLATRPASSSSSSKSSSGGVEVFFALEDPALRRGKEENGDLEALWRRLLGALLFVTRLDFAALVWKEEDIATDAEEDVRSRRSKSETYALWKLNKNWVQAGGCVYEDVVLPVCFLVVAGAGGLLSRFVSDSHSTSRLGVGDRYEVSFRYKDARRVVLIMREV